MASRIKGITVEIGGDTSGLEKSLAAVNNSIKKTQSQLREYHPSGTEAGTSAVCDWRYRKEAGSPGTGPGGCGESF